MLGEMKTKSGKNLFRKLNEHSKKLQDRQEGIIKKHNSLAAQYEELEHLKANLTDYIGRNRYEKKWSVIGAIKKFKIEEKSKPTKRKEASKDEER